MAPRGKNTLTARIALEGGSEVRKQLLALGKDGGSAFDALAKHVKQVERASVGFNGKLAQLRSRFDNLTQSVNRLGQRFSFVNSEMARLAGTVAGVFSVRALVDITDQYTELANVLQVVTDGQGDVNETIAEIGGIANRVRAPISAMATLYQRAAIAADGLGASNSDILRFTENVGLALAQQGGSAERAAGALQQLSQALGNTNVQAEEFNSLQDGAYPILLAAARGIEEAGGSVGKLRQIMLQGRLTSQEFFEAILSQSAALEESFANTTPTISQAFTVLNNNLLLFIGTSNEAAGVSKAIANAIIFVGQNIQTVAAIVLTLVGAFAAVKGVGLAVELFNIARALVAIIPALVSVGAALLANPMTLWALAIVAASTAVLALTGNLDEFVNVVGKVVSPILDAVGAMLGLKNESNEALTGAKEKTDDLDSSAETLGSRLLKVGEEGQATGSALSQMGLEGAKAADDVTDRVSETSSSIVDLTNNVNNAISSFRELGKVMKSSTGEDGSSGAPAFKGGGDVRGPGTGTSDSILAKLSNGEFVMRAAAVRKFGVGFMHQLNSLRLPRFAVGGLVDGLTGGMSMPMPALAAPTNIGGGTSGRPINLSIDGERFEGLTAPEDVAERLTRYAMGRQVRSAGRKPNWHGG